MKRHSILKYSETELTVRLGETDPYGIVNNSEYFTYFKIARLDYAQKSGIILDEMFSKSIVNMTLSAECKYVRSCKFNDVLLLKTTMKPHFVYCVFEFDQWIFNKTTNELIASGRTKTAEFCLKTRKIVRWSL